MAAAFSLIRNGRHRFLAAAMLAVAAAAAATARDDASEALPALADSSFSGAPSLDGEAQLDPVLELDALSGNVVFSSQFEAAQSSRAVHLRSHISSVAVSL